jgi:EpsI family protein
MPVAAAVESTGCVSQDDDAGLSYKLASGNCLQGCCAMQDRLDRAAAEEATDIDVVGSPSRRRLMVFAGAAAAAMAASSLLALSLRPKARDPSSPPSISLEQAIPKSFGEWRVVPQTVQLVNPQTQQMLEKLYSQLLARTYVDARGRSVMLSMAYGDDQRGGLQAHMPEVCYPAQGFQLHRSADHVLTTPFGSIAGRRVEASLNGRYEPITYWFAIGDRVVRTTWERRLAEVRMGLAGRAPEGLLFRVSSVDNDPARAFSVHERFVTALLTAMEPAQRVQLTGVTPDTAA